eukprot:COSAG06_NODE_28173_length_579_cov_0.777083_1_plen_121_part_10
MNGFDSTHFYVRFTFTNNDRNLYLNEDGFDMTVSACQPWGDDSCGESAQFTEIGAFDGPYTSAAVRLPVDMTLPTYFRVSMQVTTGDTAAGGLILFGDDMDADGDFYLWISSAGNWRIGQQ